MSLIFAEGFEHIHTSLPGMPLPTGGYLSRKLFLGSRNAGTLATVMSPLDYLPGNGISNQPSPWQISRLETDRLSVVYGMDTTVTPNVEHARKGGKAVLFSSGGSEYPLFLVLRVKKSRTLHVGFAMRQRTPFAVANKSVTVSFGRAEQRFSNPYHFRFVTPSRDSPLQDWRFLFKATGGCQIKQREGYVDCAWQFTGQTAQYTQLYHNRDLGNGDWHYFEVGTTLYGNQTDNPQAWGEVRIGGIASRRENMFTATPGSEQDSYLDTIIIKMNGYAFQSIDDIYVTNDEGDVNTSFLGSIFVRRMSPTHQGALSESISVGTTLRHEAVGPAYIGDPATLPNPLPTPEEDPNFEAWGDPRESHLVLPREGNRQTFRCSHVDFAGSSPRVFGVVGDVVANTGSPLQARGLLTPIRSVGGAHIAHSAMMDSLEDLGRMHQLVYENPDAQGLINPFDPMWGHTAVNNAEYGFRLDPIVDIDGHEGSWNSTILRYPATHEVAAFDGFGIAGDASRHMEEAIAETLTAESTADQGYACIILDDFMLDDGDSILTKVIPQFVWSNLRGQDATVFPEEFIRDGFDFECGTKVDAAVTVDDGYGTEDTSYHWWVEEFHEFLDPVDFTDRAWVATVLDDLGVEVTDIWDGHLDAEEEFGVEAYIRSNQELLEETLYTDPHAQDGVGLFAEDGIDLSAEHYDGNWVEQFEETLALPEEMLTRHWRFTLFFGTCERWEDIEPLEQPLAQGEQNPCQAINDQWQDWYMQWVEAEKEWLEGYL